MAAWDEFAKAAPEMAELGLKQLNKFGLAYLATVRKDGAPRVHPVCPFVAEGRLFVATAPTSPKRLDLQRDGRYVLHFLPGKNEEEFLVRGRATRVTDPATRAMAVEAARNAPQHVGGLNVKPEEWLFEYDIEEAATTYWENVGQPNTRPIRRKWRERSP
ncbi:MAG: pyridoxamine 5'-phosphate oxidase family protein [Dehalococcoidia bacterium]|nr:pyridoxamine 5'-phosphate oxidase family protein [Dehalococcoidia bacterium]